MDGHTQQSTRLAVFPGKHCNALETYLFSTSYAEGKREMGEHPPYTEKHVM